MKKNKKTISSFVPFVLGVLAIVMAFLPGLTYKASVFGQEIKSTISFFGLVFGNGTIKTVGGGETVTATLNGGLSIFALLSFILLVLALVIYLVRPFIKSSKKTSNFVPSVIACAFIVSGICAFLVKVAGTDIVNDFGLLGTAKTAFADVFKDYSLGIGSILYGVFAILAGLATFAPRFLKK